MNIAIDIIVALAAFGGLILGVLNYIHNRRNENTKLKIEPIAIGDLNGNLFLSSVDIRPVYDTRKYEFKTIGIEITNLSKFAVEIIGIGFVISKNKNLDCTTLVHIAGDENLKLPIEIPSRKKNSLAIPETNLTDLKKYSIHSAYARTSDDLYFYGNNEVLKQVMSQT